MLRLYPQLWIQISWFLLDHDFVEYESCCRQLAQCFRVYPYELKKKLIWPNIRDKIHQCPKKFKITHLQISHICPHDFTHQLPFLKYLSCLEFNHPLIQFPPALYHLTLCDTALNPNIQYPQQLKVLQIGSKEWSHCCLIRGQYAFPESLRILRFINCDFGQNLKGLPRDLQQLELSGDLDKVILNDIPNGLQRLCIKGWFNKPLDQLPKQLHTLVVDTNDFNQPLEHLPSSLRTLKLLGSFNQSLQFLPHQLQHLFLKSTKFDHELYNLPVTLKTLYLNMNCINKGINALPPRLETLYILCYHHVKEPIYNLPHTILHLNLTELIISIIKQLPCHLYKLGVLGGPYKSCYFATFMTIIPPSLRILTWKNTNGFSLADFPVFLTELNLSFELVQPITVWPLSLQRLRAGNTTVLVELN
jgi:hypothetical protein